MARCGLVTILRFHTAVSKSTENNRDVKKKKYILTAAVLGLTRENEIKYTNLPIPM